MQTIICNSINELPYAAQQFIAATKGSTVFAFKAAMGVGKTTFIKALCNELEVIDTVASPTFAIINEYKTKHNELIYHFDLYRLNSIQDAQNIGIEEYLYSKNMCLIEWPEIIESLLPSHTIFVSITEDEQGGRIIEIGTENN